MSLENDSLFIGCLLILEIMRDGDFDVQLTPDEQEILREAHSIVQEHRHEIPEEYR